MTMDEYAEYAKYMYEKELRYLKSRIPKAPTKPTFVRLMDEYHVKKRECL